MRGKRMIRTYNDMLLDNGIASDFDSFHQFILFFIISSFLQQVFKYLLYSTKSFVYVSKLRTFPSKHVLSLWYDQTNLKVTFHFRKTKGMIEGKRRRGCWRTRWLDNITDSMDVSLMWTPGDGEGQGSLVSMGLQKSQTQLNNWTTTTNTV